jgi:Holliday junction resolvase
MTEKKLQSEIIKYLKDKGCFVMKCPAVAGIPTGTSDIFFCYEGFYGFIEVKRSKKAKFRPLQKEFLEQIAEWSWAKAVYPENWPEIQAELEAML